MFGKNQPAVAWLIVGLGNPGKAYENTRHNAGFLGIDRLAEDLGVRINRNKFQSLTARAQIGDIPVLLMKPQTMMNQSGIAVQQAADFYRLEPENILVLSDDIHLRPGALRIRKSGSAGGQNGLKDIILCLGSENFPRIRIGVGDKPHPDADLVKWVLSRFSAEDMAVMRPAFESAAKAAVLIAQGQTDRAMNLYNRSE